LRISQPGIVTAAMDLEHLTHQGHWKTAITRLYKRVFFFDSFAKNTAVGSTRQCDTL
jgi:hypothetical protein